MIHGNVSWICDRTDSHRAAAGGRAQPTAAASSAAIRPCTLQHIQEEFARHDVRAFRTQMHERDAFRAIFSFGGTLEALNRNQVSNLEAAIVNARAFVGEVVGLLRGELAVKEPAEAVP